MNGWIFDFGRTLALGSMMATPLLPVLCGGPPVAAAAAIVEMAADPEADFHNFQSLAWAALWNVPYLQGKSGMLLEASTVQSAWQVVAFHDHDLDYEDPTLTEEDINAQFVAQGSYVEATRILLTTLAPDPLDMAEAGIYKLNRYASAGTIQGATGYATAVFGLIEETSFPSGPFGNQLYRVISFTPLGFAGSVEEAVGSAEAFAEDLGVELGMMAAAMAGGADSDTGETAPPSQDNPTQPTPETHPVCFANYELCMDGCRGVRNAEILLCVGAGIAATAACLATKCKWLAWCPPCMKACTAVCIGVGAVAFAACVNAVVARYRQCANGCLADLNSCTGAVVNPVLIPAVSEH